MDTLRSRAGTARGFTLIEILVVVAIIAILISILIPSLRVAREESRAVVCGTNLDTIFTGVLLYTHDNQEVLPHLGYRSDKTAISWWWTTQIARYIGNKYEVYVCPSDTQPSQTHVLVSGRALTAVNPATPPPGAITLDVTYNGACDLMDDTRSWPVIVDGLRLTVSPVARRITSIKRPAMNIALVEGLDPKRTETCFRFERLAQIDDRQVSWDKVAVAAQKTWDRHNKSTNVLFMDGHVSRHTRREIGTKISHQQEFLPVPVTVP